MHVDVGRKCPQCPGPLPDAAMSECDGTTDFEKWEQHPTGDKGEASSYFG